MIHYFETLGLQKGATQKEIQAAYDRLSKELDPKNNDNQEFFIEEYKKVQEAYKALSNSSILGTSSTVPAIEKSKSINKLKKNQNSNSKEKKMKNYSKIVGVLITISLLVSLFALTYIIFDNPIDSEEATISFFLLILNFAFLFYMYIHNFGFSYKSEIPINKFKSILILSIATFLFSIIVPTFSYLKAYQKEKMISSDITKKWPEKKSWFGLSANLKTKYSGNNMKYILEIKDEQKSRLNYNLTKVEIVFQDEDGFKLRSIIIDNFTNRVNDEGEVYGKYTNSDLYMSYDQYSNFSSWSLLRY